VLDALAAAIDEQIIARPVTLAPKRALAMQEETAKELGPKHPAFDAQPRTARGAPAAPGAPRAGRAHHPRARGAPRAATSPQRPPRRLWALPNAGRRGYHFCATGSYGGTPASAAGTTPPRLVTSILTILPRHAKRAHTRCGWGHGSHWCS